MTQINGLDLCFNLHMLSDTNSFPLGGRGKEDVLSNATDAWPAERNGELHLASSYCEVLSQGYNKDGSFVG